jgi:hypothetical protein
MADFEKDLEKLFAERMKTDDEFCKLIWGAMANVEKINIYNGKFDMTISISDAILISNFLNSIISDRNNEKF